MARKLKKSCLLGVGALLLALTVSASQSNAEVNVRVGINLPPVRFAAPPAVVVIPGTYVYAVPDYDVEVLFYQGYWWRPYQGQWYRSHDYKGKWSHVDQRRVPGGLRALPSDYRHHLAPEHQRIHHRDVKRNWKKWEREKYWDNRGDRGRDGHGDRDRDGHGDRDRDGHGDKGRGGR